jgi:hypothetical protein
LNFLLNYRWTVLIDFVEWKSITQNTFPGLVAILRLCCTLVATVEITSYACVQQSTFWVALYNDATLIFLSINLFNPSHNLKSLFFGLCNLMRFNFTFYVTYQFSVSLRLFEKLDEVHVGLEVFRAMWA